eukprot:s16_g12.t1
MNPMAPLSLVEHPTHDPQYYALLQTMMLFRTTGPGLDHFEFVMQQLHVPRLQGLPPPGPCHVVLSRLHQIGWGWMYSDVFRDHHGMRIAILRCPIQELKTRLVEGWQSRVLGILQERQTFEGAPFVFPSLTVAAMQKYPPDQQAILRTAETLAVISACEFAVLMKVSITLWVDNDLVFKRLRRFQHGSMRIARNQTDADLWERLQILVQRLGSQLMFVGKIVSHQQQEVAENECDAWLFRGNSAADAVASSAYARHPELMNIWNQLVNDLTDVQILRNMLHKVIISIGKSVVYLRLEACRTVSGAIKVREPWQGEKKRIPLSGLKHDWGHVAN